MIPSEKRKIIKQRSNIRTKKEYIKKSLTILEDFNNITDSNIDFLREWYEWDYDYIKDNSLSSLPSKDDNEMIYALLYFFIRRETLISEKLKNIISACVGNNDAGKCYNLVTGITPKKCYCGSGDDLKYRDYYSGFNIGCNTTTCSYFQSCAKDGVLKKYGVDNVFKCEEIKDKIKETNIEKYGAANPFASDIIKDKIKETNIENLGCEYPTQNKNIIEKRRNNNIEKYGTIHHLKLDEFKEKQRQTNIKKYGVDNVSKIKEVRNKVKETNIKKYGYECNLSSPEVIDQIKKTNMKIHNTDYIPRKHISEENVIKLNDKNWMEENINCKSTFEIATDLGCHITTIQRYLKKHEIEYKPIFKGENEISIFLQNNGFDFLKNDRVQIKPKELDFYLPDYNLAIEVNGIYYHSDIFKENDYHLNKYKLCKEKGIRLISINEDEWNENSEIIKSKIKSLTGKSEKGVPARKTNIKEISFAEANIFCEKYHIQGSTSSVIYSAGAFYNSELIGVILFNKQRITGDIELIRFCHDGKIHSGLFSKMLNFSIKNNNWSKIISFADLRYSDGNLYEVNGFTKEKIIPPDYRYVYNNKTFHKSNFTKDRIQIKFDLSKEYVDSKTERELMEELGFCRLYDIGKIKYVMEI